MCQQWAWSPIPLAVPCWVFVPWTMSSLFSMILQGFLQLRISIVDVCLTISTANQYEKHLGDVSETTLESLDALITVLSPKSTQLSAFRCLHAPDAAATRSVEQVLWDFLPPQRALIHRSQQNRSRWAQNQTPRSLQHPFRVDLAQKDWNDQQGC